MLSKNNVDVDMLVKKVMAQTNYDETTSKQKLSELSSVPTSFFFNDYGTENFAKGNTNNKVNPSNTNNDNIKTLYIGNVNENCTDENIVQVSSYDPFLNLL